MTGPVGIIRQLLSAFRNICQGLVELGGVDGDVLTSIDGVPLDSATALTATLDRHYPGDVLNLTWIDRSGQQRSGKATLTPGP